MSIILPNSYYLSNDTLFLARDLLGKSLLTQIDGSLTGGIIVETEAYLGSDDRASHAYNHRRTKRNEAMYAAGGIAYVYLCYGIHFMFNIVTHGKDHPHAILIRAIHPTTGIETMLKRRKKPYISKILTSGPGTLTQALGITTLQNNTPLTGPLIWLEDRNHSFKNDEVIATPRIGIDYAGVDALKPWRFVVKDFA